MNQQVRTQTIAQIIGRDRLLPWDPPSQPEYIKRDGEVLIRWWLEGQPAEVADWTTQRVRFVLDEWLMTTDRQDLTPPQLFVCGCGVIENFADEGKAGFDCPSVLSAVTAMLDGLQSVSCEAVGKMVELIGEAENTLSHQMDSSFSLQDEEHAMLNLLKVVGRLVIASESSQENTDVLRFLKIIADGDESDARRIRSTDYFAGS